MKVRSIAFLALRYVVSVRRYLPVRAARPGRAEMRRDTVIGQAPIVIITEYREYYFIAGMIKFVRSAEYSIRGIVRSDEGSIN